MTKNLERAFAEAAKLPDSEQDAVAEWLLAELASDRAWDDSFAASRDKLSELGAEALREHRAGRSESLNPEKL